MKGLDSVKTPNELVQLLLRNNKEKQEFFTLHDVPKLKKVCGSIEKALQFPIVCEIMGRSIADKLLDIGLRTEQIDRVIGSEASASLVFATTRWLSILSETSRLVRPSFTRRCVAGVGESWTGEWISPEESVLQIDLNLDMLWIVRNTISSSSSTPIRFLRPAAVVEGHEAKRCFGDLELYAVSY